MLVQRNTVIIFTSLILALIILSLQKLSILSYWIKILATHLKTVVLQAQKIGLSAVKQNTSASSNGKKKSGHISSISYTYDPNVLIFDKGLYTLMRLPLKCDISNPVVKCRMKILYKCFSGLCDLSQIIWTPENSLPLQWQSTTMRPFISPDLLLWFLAFCTAVAADLLRMFPDLCDL